MIYVNVSFIAEIGICHRRVNRCFHPSREVYAPSHDGIGRSAAEVSSLSTVQADVE